MRRLSTIFLTTGVAAGAIGAVGIATGTWANLPPAVIRAMAMALPFVLAGALLVIGAVLGRVAHRSAAPPSPRPDTMVRAPLALGDAALAMPVRQPADATPIPRERAT